MPFLAREDIRLDIVVENPEDAIRQAGEVLVETNVVSPNYVDKMVSNFYEHGPYFVIAPQVAMPHARPEDGVHRSGLSLVRLKKGIEFGHPFNDPVQIVIGLAASSSNDHLNLLQRISVLLGNKDTKEKLLSISSIDELEQMIKEISE